MGHFSEILEGIFLKISKKVLTNFKLARFISDTLLNLPLRRASNSSSTMVDGGTDGVDDVGAFSFSVTCFALTSSAIEASFSSDKVDSIITHAECASICTVCCPVA